MSTARSFPPPLVPKEHGAWAVLFAPILLAAFFVQSVSWNLLLLILCLLFVFMSYLPMQTLLREVLKPTHRAGKLLQAKVWGPTYLAFGMLFLLPLLYRGYILIFPLGLLGAGAFVANFFFTRKHPRTIPGDLISVCGLSLGAPAAYYVLTGKLDAGAFTLWLLNIFYFGGSVLYVHMKIAATIRKTSAFDLGERLLIGRWTLAFSLLLILAALSMEMAGVIKQYMLVAFLPIVLQMVYGTFTLSPKVRFKNLGFLLLGQSVLFTILAGLINRL